MLSDKQWKWISEQRKARADQRREEYAAERKVAHRTPVHPNDALQDPDPRNHRITPEEVQRRIAIINAKLMVNAALRGVDPTTLPVQHLWYPEDDRRKYTLRAGNPPPHSERPKHLRGLALQVDPAALPEGYWEWTNRLAKQHSKQHRKARPSIDTAVHDALAAHLPKFGPTRQ